MLERNNYIEAVSRTYGIDYQILKQKVEEHAYKAPQAMQQERKQVQKKREKDEGLKAAQRLLLTWLSDHPGQLNQLADIIMPEDFLILFIKRWLAFYTSRSSREKEIRQSC